MKSLIKILLSVLFLMINAMVYSQESMVTIQQMAEQEAHRQTDKMQKEINLSPEQVKQVFEINLRYARERQLSNTRSEALERIKNKDAEIQRILTPEQNNKLKNKRYDRTSFTKLSESRNAASNTSSNTKTPTEGRTNSLNRLIPTDVNQNNETNNLRNTNRSRSSNENPHTGTRTSETPSTRTTKTTPRTGSR